MCTHLYCKVECGKRYQEIWTVGRRSLRVGGEDDEEIHEVREEFELDLEGWMGGVWISGVGVEVE